LWACGGWYGLSMSAQLHGWASPTSGTFCLNGAEQVRRQVPQLLDRLPARVVRCEDLLERAKKLPHGIAAGVDSPLAGTRTQTGAADD
jgi:hypothetical protein